LQKFLSKSIRNFLSNLSDSQADGQVKTLSPFFDGGNKTKFVHFLLVYHYVNFTRNKQYRVAQKFAQ